MQTRAVQAATKAVSERPGMGGCSAVSEDTRNEGKHVAVIGSKTHILVRDDLNTLNVAGGLEDLLQDLFGDSRVQAANVQRSLVGLRSGTAGTTSAARGIETIVTHGRANRVRVEVGVLGDVERGVLAGSRAGRGSGGHLSRVVGHVLFLEGDGGYWGLREQSAVEQAETINRTKSGREA